MDTTLYQRAASLQGPSAWGGVVPRPSRSLVSCRGPWSYTDVVALDEGVRGELIAPPSRSRFHDDDGPRAWWLRLQPEVRCRGYEFSPDAAGWRVERMPDLPDEDYFSLSPDWVCEFRSHCTPKRRVMDAYAHLGVGHVWLFGLHERRLQVFRREDTRWLRLATFSGDVCFSAEPFDDKTLDLGWLLSHRGKRDG